VRLAGVRLETGDLDRAVDVFTAITGTAPEREADSARFALEDASVQVTLRPGGAGLVAVALSGLEGGSSEAPPNLNGIRIEPTTDVVPRGHAKARLDHVAVLVADLKEAAAAWSALAGTAAEMMGVHPVSGGAFMAARLHLDDRMIELVQPVEGVDSPLARRLASHGEGAATLALPVVDVPAARARLDAIGARVLFTDPHWMVHPRDTGGVLVQLTPRVAH
jgi:catechol 2,3-dioxygenase-like lactoylglutathione lyase family enzyme